MTPTPDTGSLAAMAIVLLFVYLLVGAGLYVWTGLAMSRLFARLSSEPWKGWVPFVNTAEVLALGGYSPWLVLLLVVPIANLVGVAFYAMAAHRINALFGRGVGMTVLAVLVPPLWATLLAWGRTAPDPERGRLATALGGQAAPTGPLATVAPGSTGYPAYPGAPASNSPAAPSSTWPAWPGAATPATSPVAGSAVPAEPAAPAASPVALVGPAYPAPAPAGYASAPTYAPSDSAQPLQPATHPLGAEAAASPVRPIVPPAPIAPPPSQHRADEPAAHTLAEPPSQTFAEAPAHRFAEPPAHEAIAAVPAAAPPAPGAPAAPPAQPAPDLLAYEPAAPDRLPAPAPAFEAPDGFDYAEAATIVVHPEDDDVDETVVVARAPRVTWQLVLDDGDVLELSGTSVVLGRNPAAAAGEQRLVVPDRTRTLSKTHARLDHVDGGWTITDLGSTNGVLIVDEDGGETLLDPDVAVPVTGRFVLGEVGIRLSEAAR
ncbi:DUF5684 domain-containing protein [Agromyces sp. G08B096]|uniref:DUF5684 domain-containing protein n=1 Tax=Agromyces sp. G08B096 TaxID=3156399 RepID=A0AAU7W569_9MICO